MSSETYLVYHSHVFSSEFDNECLKIRRWSGVTYPEDDVICTMLYTKEDAQVYADLILKYKGTLFKKTKVDGRVKFVKL